FLAGSHFGQALHRIAGDTLHRRRLAHRGSVFRRRGRYVNVEVGATAPRWNRAIVVPNTSDSATWSRCPSPGSIDHTFIVIWDTIAPSAPTSDTACSNRVRASSRTWVTNCV